jgi:hypothetical protein
MIFFLCFGFGVLGSGLPGTQTVSHFFPKLCAALQKKFGAMLRVAPAPAVFST